MAEADKDVNQNISNLSNAFTESVKFTDSTVIDGVPVSVKTEFGLALNLRFEHSNKQKWSIDSSTFQISSSVVYSGLLYRESTMTKVNVISNNV